MAPSEDDKESCRGPAPAATSKASKLEAEEESSTEAGDQKADETVAAEVDADCRFKDEPDDDDVIRNFNKMGRMKLFKPEFIEDLKREHRTHLALCKKHYEEIFKEMEEEERLAAAAAAAQSSS